MKIEKTEAYYDAMMVNKMCDFLEFLEEELGIDETQELVRKYNERIDKELSEQSNNPLIS